MKVTLIYVCVLYNSVSFGYKENYIADRTYLEKQRDILRLYNYVHYPSKYEDIVEAAKSFKFDEDYDRWTNPKYPKEFLKHYHDHGFVRKEEVFSPFNSQHIKQAISLFKTMFYAKEYRTFFEIASWSRQNINSGMFIFAFTSAVIHSKHATDIIIPAMYEVNPHLFFEMPVLQKALEAHNKIKEVNPMPPFSGIIIENDPETMLGVYRSDIDFLVSYFYHIHFDPFWLPSNETFDGIPHRGENFYNYLQKTLARYTLERESHGLTEIPELKFEAIKDFQFNREFVYPNGLKFPCRNQTNFLNLGKHYLKLKDYERRIRDAIDKGTATCTFTYVPYSLYSPTDEEGFATFANLLQSNPDSLNQKYYGDILYHVRKILGNSTNIPGVLEQFETSPRDPLFWQMMKRFFNFFNQYKSHLLPYSENELGFEGVKINDIVLEDVTTFFDYIYVDLCKSFEPTEKNFQENSCNIHTKQKVLHHKPFNYEIKVSSKKPVKAFVKVFIGPYLANHGFLKENIIHFYELERFKISLTIGNNTIKRKINSSHEERFSYNKFFQKVLSALDGKEELIINGESGQFFPNRLKFPKGNETGQEFTLFVVVVPYHPESAKQMWANFNIDFAYPFGFPLDRPIEESDFMVPNFFMKSLVIKNKNLESVSPLEMEYHYKYE